MDKIISEWITMLEPGEPQTHENMTVFPIPNPTSGGPRYISLSAALRVQSIVVTEVDQGGSVPELKVINKGDVPVLLLDGEELAGAKQNRVLNTTILVPKMSELIIPVSCTEEGRWSWSSPEFTGVLRVEADYVPEDTAVQDEACNRFPGRRAGLRIRSECGVERYWRSAQRRYRSQCPWILSILFCC